MRINSLSYCDREQQWGFDKIEFFNLTLLVGISGVGKTQILKSIIALRNIAKGKPINGAEWSFCFSNDGKEYVWTGKYELKNQNSFTEKFKDNDEEDTNKPKLLKESLSLNGNIIASRDEKDIFFEGTKMPRLSSNESLISLFKEEAKVNPAFEGFKRIIFRDHTEKESTSFLRLIDLRKIKQKYKSLDAIKESDNETVVKLYLLAENQKKIFEEIKDSFIDVFPQVEDIKIEPLKDENLPAFISEIPIIHIKESEVDKWIPQNRISSGMIRTLIHISEMYLLSEGTVILIDEFENSLGVNCISVLTEDLIFDNNKLQFIAISHHPYIINKIPYEYWKIVTRKGGEIKVHDAKEFDLGESHHERFMSLINLPEYKKGIEIN